MTAYSVVDNMGSINPIARALGCGTIPLSLLDPNLIKPCLSVKEESQRKNDAAMGRVWEVYLVIACDKVPLNALYLVILSC